MGQNVFFGDEKKFSRGGLIDFKKMYEATRKSLSEVGLEDVKPEKHVRELNFATRQMVEIARTISKAYTANVEHALILLDRAPPPCSTRRRSQLLYRQVRALAAQGALGDFRLPPP